MLLKDKVALVTGGSRGIGRAIVHTFATHGAHVAVVATREDGARSIAEEAARQGVRAIGVACDVSDSASVDTMVGQVHTEFGKLDIVVNNAGITRDGLLMRMSDEEWDRVIAVNLKGVFNVTRAAARIMLKQRSGKIVNISSVVGVMGNAGQVNYAASKAGIIGLTKSAAKELASRGITVNAVAPGFITTDMTAAVNEPARSNALQAIPLKRFGEPAEVASAVLFLASPLSDYITGHVLHVDGGMVM